jgi:glycosyltransferase involved in cell wall biosynthesis
VSHIAYIVTIPLTAKVHLRGHLSYLRQQGFRITLISTPGPDLDEVAQREGIDVIPVPMARDIALRKDAASLWGLYDVLRHLRPDAVNAGTPKAGFLGMMAARACGVPLRVYTLHGNRGETLKGNKQRIVQMTEHLTSAAAHHVMCVSDSLRDAYIRAGLAPAEKVTVLANGSANGLDAGRFELTEDREHEVSQLRQKLGLADHDRVIGFVGRFTRDKGIIDLVNAWQAIKDDFPDLKLLLLGRFEDDDPIPEEMIAFIKSNPQIILPGFIENTSLYYHLMDVLVLPSYREGFPVVPLEAAAAGIPTAGYAATGMVDAIVDGKTGLLAPLGDASGLSSHLARLLSNEALRREMGKAAYDRVTTLYRPEVVWSAWASFYNRALRSNIAQPAMIR